MKTEGKRVCEVCGTALNEKSEFCPVCALLRAGGQESAPSEALDPVSDSETSAAETEPSSIVRRFENYEVMLGQDGQPIELGRGAMGITYKAFDIDLRFPVTLKVISEKYVGDESARSRFLREARAAAKVRHTNVASVLHLGRTGSGYFYAMEFVEGETLESLIKRSGRLEVKLALEIAAQVAAGLAAVHKQSLVHCDIKPSNIMVALDPGGALMVKIIDLGLAKGASELGSESEISSPGAFAGTPAFASPEQFAGLGSDIRSDLYSLGVTLWEMLAGQVPFRGSPSELMHEHQQAPLPLEQLQGLPQPVVVLLEVMLAKDPNQRFQTPAQFQQALTIVRSAIGSGFRLTADKLRLAGDKAAGDLPKRKPRRRPVHWLIAAGLCLGGLLICWFFVSGRAGLFYQRAAEASPTEKSIAVLPFENISANKDDAYFADGVQDEILNNLAKIAQLKVISRTSVMQYRGDNKRDLRQIAAVLGVANVLEGTVRRDGNHVRVSTELVDASDDKTIWADSYDRDLTDIFAIQSEVAQAIANRLTATISPDEKKWIEAKPTDNLEAYDLYLRANELILNIGTNGSIGNVAKPLREAIALLKQAVQLDPKFTLAYCAAADAHGSLYHFGDRTPERRVLADAAINNALRLQPDLPKVRLTYALYLYHCYRDYERARVQLAIARRGMPNSSEAIMLGAFMDRRQGDFRKAIQELDDAIALDPRNAESIAELGNTLFWMRQFDAAQRAYDRLIELAPDQPMLRVQRANFGAMKSGDDSELESALAAVPTSMSGDTGVLSWRLRFALNRRDWQQAKELIEKMKGGEDDGMFGYQMVPLPIGCYSILLARLQGEQPSVNPASAETREQLKQKVEKSPENALLLGDLSLVDALLNDKEVAISEAKRATEMLPVAKDAVDGPGMLVQLAVVYAWTNEFDLAFETLGSLTKVPNGPFYGDLKLNAYWTPLRKDPRFDKLLAELAPREPAGKSIAVLPFESLSDNKSDTYFADGVQDEILNNLAKIAQLKVISRTSVMQYRPEAKRNLRQIAADLDVANVLEGTVRRDGNHVRVSTELVDARNDSTIWADSYDRNLTDIFAIQSEIAQTVASRLSAQLSPERRRDIEGKPTDNLEAYDLYLQAKRLLEANYYILPSGEKEVYSKIISLLEETTQKDGRFALAYCLIAKAHDILYLDDIDRTAERRALGDAAVNEALRLRPDLPEVHLAMAYHLYYCYRDFERAGIQIAIATQGLSNNPGLLELTALIDRVQGRWEKAVAALEKAMTIDPRNSELAGNLTDTYWALRRYRDAERIVNRQIEFAPDQLSSLISKAIYAYCEKADVKDARAACEALPSSAKDDPFVAQYRFYFAMCARDFAAAEENLNKDQNKDIGFYGVLVPHQIAALWLEFLRGNHPTAEEFGAARDQLYQKVEADPTNPYLVTVLAYADLALGRTEESMGEGRRAMELRPISEDAFEGPEIATWVTQLYSLTNQLDVAFGQLDIVVKMPGGGALNYGDLKNNPAWDSLRKDPRFEKLLAELAPRD
ncbi:MAG: protein kinase [Verrucomicrobia bacterium]|nr:protein kinase [Verrucomicrobiota bacterium]